MKAELLMPQEVEVFYALPAIRKELATAMKASGKKQKEIAKLLCVKESTISQYMSEKRASGMKFNDTIKQAAAEAAGRITDRVTLIQATQKLLNLIKEEKILCGFHMERIALPKGCCVCFVK
jgi:uncharacterized protein